MAKKALFEAKNKDKKGYPYPENLGDSEVVNLLNAFNAAKASKAEVKKDDSKKDSKKVTIDEWNAAEKKKEEAAKKAAEEEAKKPVNVVLKQFKDAVKKAEEILKNKEKYNYGVVTKVEKLLPQVKALNLKASTLYDVEESAAYKPARDLVEVVTGAKIVDNVDKNTQKDNKGDKKNEQKDNKDNKGTQDNKGGKKVSFPAAVLIPAETFNKGCKDDNKTCPNKKTEKCDKTDKGQKPCTKPAQKCAPAKTVAQAQAQKSESPKTGDAGIAYGVMGLLTSAGAFLGLRKKNHR